MTEEETLEYMAHRPKQMRLGAPRNGPRNFELGFTGTKEECEQIRIGLRLGGLVKPSTDTDGYLWRVNEHYGREIAKRLIPILESGDEDMREKAEIFKRILQ